MLIFLTLLRNYVGVILEKMFTNARQKISAFNTIETTLDLMKKKLKTPSSVKKQNIVVTIKCGCGQIFKILIQDVTFIIWFLNQSTKISVRSTISLQRSVLWQLFRYHSLIKSKSSFDIFFLLFLRLNGNDLFTFYLLPCL